MKVKVSNYGLLLTFISELLVSRMFERIQFSVQGDLVLRFWRQAAY